MDAPEAELDIKLQRIAGDLLADFDRSLPTVIRKTDSHGASRVRSRVRLRDVAWLTSNLLDPFQELPQLLDPHLPKWVPFLSDAFLEHLQSRRLERHKTDDSGFLVSVEYAICKILYTLCKIRGEKVIVRFLNVETKYLELVLTAMEDAEGHALDGNPLRKWQWEQRYVALLWLSHLLLAPFDLSTISSADLDDSATSAVPGLSLSPELPGITLRVLPLAIKYLSSPGKERDGAKALLVRIAMRRDMQQLGVLDSLMNWALGTLQPEPNSSMESTYTYLGVLSFLAGILRASSHTSDLDKFLPSIFRVAHSIASEDNELSKAIISFAFARKMIIKVLREVVLSKLRDASDDVATTELTETAIGYLLENLSDKDTSVRFAASKSLSIVALKLDPEMAADVVEAVLESLNRNVLWKQPSAKSGNKPLRDLSSVDSLEWHGLMLTLSHLLYRRSPPARQLSDIIHALLLGLSFEQRGTSGASVGANVRDAACFGIWALARRYTTQELLSVPTKSVFAAKSHPETSSILQVLGTELVVTASLDPASNIRRGSSAALQELIGRHPDTVEKGIWVVQTVDYYAVARRSRAMQEVSFNATKLSSQLGEAVLDAMLGWRGVGDADVPSRRDVGEAFGAITAELSSASDNPVSCMQTFIQLINGRLAALENRQVEERHGLLLCFAALIDNFPKIVMKDDPDGQIGESLIRRLIHTIIVSVSGILEDLNKKTYRKPELITEAAGKLVISLVPVLQIAMLRRIPWSDLKTMDQLLAPDNTSGYLQLTTALDANRSPDENVQKLLAALKDIVPSWLGRHEQDTVDAASGAALVLLLFSDEQGRKSMLNDWAETVRKRPQNSKSTQGDGYFYALAMAQPLVQAVDPEGSARDMACEAILERWDSETQVEARVAILQSLTRSRVLREKPLVFLNLLASGLNDYTTNARGDVGSHVRVQALKAVNSLWDQRNGVGGTDEWMASSLRTLLYSTLRLSAEKLDRIRPKAQTAVALILHESHRQEFKSLTFSSQEYFYSLLQLVRSDHLQPAVADIAKSDPAGWMAELMAGYATSADTGNEVLVVASRAALIQFCESSSENRDLVCNALLQNLKQRQGDDRFIVPTLEIIAFLFQVGIFQHSTGINLRSLCLQTQKAGYKTGNIRKIEACVQVYGGVAATEPQDTPAVQEARKRLGALLFHPWPKVRVMVVDQIWGLLGDNDAQAGEKLTGIDWGKADKSQVKTVVSELGLG